MNKIKITIEIEEIEEKEEEDNKDTTNNNSNDNNIINIIDSNREEKELKSFLGEEFIGYKGRDAIDKLMSERRGHIKDAFFRKEIGDIALVWGDNRKGLQHIIKRRKELKQPLGKLFDTLTEVIENGEIEIDIANKKFTIFYKRKTAIIGFRILKDGKFKFLLTAYYDYDYRKNTSW